MPGTGQRSALFWRTRTPQVLLAVGAVLLVTAVTTLALVETGHAAQPVLFTAAAGLALMSVAAAHGAGLRHSAEACAAASAGLALAGALADGDGVSGAPAPSLVLAGAFLVLHLVARAPVSWPLAAWAAAQLAALRLADDLPTAVHTELQLGVALLGLALALRARPGLARIALVTTAPWWLSGVFGGSADAWSGDQGGRWLAAALMVGAGAALVPARRRPELAPLLGPPRLAPVVAGMVAGAALTGAVSPSGTSALVAAGWTGVFLASGAAVVLGGRFRALLLVPAVAGGATVAALCTAQLAQDAAWGALSALLLAVAVPPAGASLLRRSTRPVAVPVSVWCLAGSALLGLRAGVLDVTTTAVLLAALYSAAMALGSGLDGDVRRPTAAAAALTGALAIALPALGSNRDVLLLVLATQSVATLGWALRTGRVTGADVATAPPEDAVAQEISAGWRIGAAHLTLAGWTWAALVDARTLEAWTYPLAAGLLVAAGPRLLAAPSWPSWGPGLVVALAPSTVWALLEPDAGRAVWVLLVAAGVLVGGAVAGAAAPLAVGAGAAVVLVLGLAVPALPWPLGAALVTGAGLLALGAFREWRPVGAFRLRLAQLR